jgi:hypothetical protein
MSHEEVKQEHKESEGNPQLKGKIRQKQREIADRASVSAVPKADFVVTNPTHYAVALRYDDATMAAPRSLPRARIWWRSRFAKSRARTRYRCWSLPCWRVRSMPMPIWIRPSLLRSTPPWPRCWPMSIVSRLH